MLGSVRRDDCLCSETSMIPRAPCGLPLPTAAHSSLSAEAEAALSRGDLLSRATDYHCPRLPPFFLVCRRRPPSDRHCRHSHPLLLCSPSLPRSLLPIRCSPCADAPRPLHLSLVIPPFSSRSSPPPATQTRQLLAPGVSAARRRPKPQTSQTHLP